MCSIINIILSFWFGTSVFYFEIFWDIKAKSNNMMKNDTSFCLIILLRVPQFLLPWWSAQLLLPDCSFFEPRRWSAQLLLPDCSFFDQLSSFFRIAPSSSRSAPSSELLILRSAQLLLPDCSFFDQLSFFFRIAHSSISSAPSSGLLLLRAAPVISSAPSSGLLLLRSAQLLLPDCSFFEPRVGEFRGDDNTGWEERPNYGTWASTSLVEIDIYSGNSLFRILSGRSRRKIPAAATTSKEGSRHANYPIPTRGGSDNT